MNCLKHIVIYSRSPSRLLDFFSDVLECEIDFKAQSFHLYHQAFHIKESPLLNQQKTEFYFDKIMLRFEQLTNQSIKNNIEFKDGDTFTFKDNIFDYSEDKNIRKMAKPRSMMPVTSAICRVCFFFCAIEKNKR